jgi:hypothetical protein
MLGDKAAIIRLDPALDSLVSADAKLDLVKNNFGFTESVVWVDEGKSDYTGYDIWRVGMPQPDANRKDVFFMIGSNGLALDRQGRPPGRSLAMAGSHPNSGGGGAIGGRRAQGPVSGGRAG